MILSHKNRKGSGSKLYGENIKYRNGYEEFILVSDCPKKDLIENEY